MNNNGNSILKKINILGAKANELIAQNALLTNEISNYQKLFSSNKNYITLYFNILAEKKKESKKKAKNNKNTNINTNTNTEHINKIKDIIIKNHSEIKEQNNLFKQKINSIKQKNKSYIFKLFSETNKLSEYCNKISEDNFLYDNAIISKDNLIKCLQKDLINIKKNLYEDIKYIYLKYNFQNIYRPVNQTQSNTNNKNNKNDSTSFEEGENEFNKLLLKERQQFIIRMKLRGEMRLKYRKMNVKKNALNDLVTSISFINKTEIIPSKNNNIFQILNKKIGGVIKNYEKYFNEDEDEEIIDENYFIFLPFELEINKDEISELVQTDITLPNKKLQSKSINEYKKKNNHIKNNRSFINVPKLNFLQIEFNKEKISYSDCESENSNNNKDKKDENDLNNKNENKNITNNNNDNSNKSKNKNEELNIKIKKLKKDIKYLKKKNHKMKRLINDFEKFQKKIKDKFIIFEKKMLNKKEENIEYLKEK